MADVVGIDSDCDPVTRYGYAFRKRFIFSNFSNSWPAHNLFQFVGTQAVQPQIDKHVSSNQIGFVTGMGHGLYDTYTGYQNKPVWSAGQRLSHLRGAIVHLLSCQTGALLGRSMVDQGVQAFWGYTVNFSFYHKNPPPNDLAQDNVAEPFLRMDCIIDRGVLGGKTADQIYDSITKYCALVYPQLPTHQRATFLDNYLHLVCPATTWGRANATI